jgi:hypothetical protein
MDALSDLLRVVQLTGAVYLDGAFSAPWCVIGASDSALCAAYLPPSERVVSFHLVTEGSCWAMLPHDPGSALLVRAGEVIVVPQGETHLLGSSTDLSPELMAPLLAKQVETIPGEVMTLAYGGDGAITRMVCGFLAAQDIWRNPLLSALPRLFKVGVRGSSASWLEPSLRFAAEEAASAHAGSGAVLAKLASWCSSRRCGATSTRCLTIARGGLPDCAIASLRARSHSCMRARRNRGPWKSWRAASACRVPGSRSDSRTCLGCHRCNTWRSGACSWPRSNCASPISRCVDRGGVGYESEAAFNRAYQAGVRCPARQHGAGTPTEPATPLKKKGEQKKKGKKKGKYIGG